jgi:hypothetical protein
MEKKMEIKLEDSGITTMELNSFNEVGDQNWKNEFFNTAFPNSFLVTERADDNKLTGTQGFMEYKINYFGEMRLAFRSERTLLSAECGGKGVFKKQIELGKSELFKRGGALCFGSTTALKAFKAAGFKVFNGYRVYEFKSFSFLKTVHLTIRHLLNYLSHNKLRILQRKLIISDLYDLLFFKSLLSHFNLVSFFRDMRQSTGSEIVVNFTEFGSNDRKITHSISEKFNSRDNAIYLWIDADFSRDCHSTTHYSII